VKGLREGVNSVVAKVGVIEVVAKVEFSPTNNESPDRMSVGTMASKFTYA
jgi:hypothetical protein